MKTRVLITVKTYPTLSTKYRELVCTAGFREDGEFIRIYPIPYREMNEYARYEKYEWIELDLEKNRKDFRPETYRAINPKKLKRGEKIGTDKGFWTERKKVVLKKVYEDMALLISEAKDKNKKTSLAVFKPYKITKFLIKPDTREWDPKKLAQFKQGNIFDKNNSAFKPAKKLPYKFSYVFQDRTGKVSTLQILDWEIGELFWNCLRRHKDEKMACKDVKTKYFDEFTKTKDLYFFLGTTKEFHFVSPNPFLIIGVFYPKIVPRGGLF